VGQARRDVRHQVGAPCAATSCPILLTVNRNGKIAMKFDEEGDAILAVETCTENDDVLLTADTGQCIRFSVGDVRVFAGRSSQGVRGIQLGANDRAISMTILEGSDATAAERAAYLSRSGAERRAAGGDEEAVVLTNEEVGESADLSDQRFEQLKAHEQVIRVPVKGIRIASRATKGVTIFDTAEGEKVVSVERISEPEEAEGESGPVAEAPAADAQAPVTEPETKPDQA
jgi:DNA gyrase/topoisomerase IV subunit A